MADRYSIVFNPAGLAYVRQALGARPYDEVWMLVQSLEQQREQHDNPPPPPAPAPDKVADPGEAVVAALRVRRPRARPNGAAAPTPAPDA